MNGVFNEQSKSGVSEAELEQSNVNINYRGVDQLRVKYWSATESGKDYSQRKFQIEWSVRPKTVIADLDKNPGHIALCWNHRKITRSLSYSPDQCNSHFSKLMNSTATTAIFISVFRIGWKFVFFHDNLSLKPFRMCPWNS